MGVDLTLTFNSRCWSGAGWWMELVWIDLGWLSLGGLNWAGHQGTVCVSLARLLLVSWKKALRPPTKPPNVLRASGWVLLWTDL
jgi:hypothetical protein